MRAAQRQTETTRGATLGAMAASAAAPAPEPVPQRSLIDDPGQAYTEAVKTALIAAMLEYSTKFSLAPGEWLTVAARESVVVDRRFVNGPSEAPMTVILRIKGSDLQALREGSLARDEASARSVVRS